MKFITFLFFIIFVGCSLKPKPVVDNTQAYILKDDNTQAYISNKQNDKILKITNPSLPMYLNNQNITYLQNFKTNTYALNFLEDTPSNFYVFMLLSKFEKSNIFKALINEDSDVFADYVLESRIDAFEQVINKDENYILIKISVNILDLNTNKLINHKYFQIKQDVKEQEIKDVVNSFNKALNNINNEIVAWVGENFKDLK